MSESFERASDPMKQSKPAGTAAANAAGISKSGSTGMSSAKRGITTRKLTFCAMCTALALVTGEIRLFSLPTGGSVTLLRMLFVVLPGWFYGIPFGAACGLILGLLNFVLGPYFLSFPQFLFDFILAFSIMGISGLFRNRKRGLIEGYVAAVLGRWIMASIAGLIWVSLGSTPWEGWAPLPYSLAYNGAYILTEGVLTVVILLIPSVRKALTMIKEMALKQSK